MSKSSSIFIAGKSSIWVKSILPAIAFSFMSMSVVASTPSGDITEYSIEDLLNMSSSIATRSDTDARHVPAIVTVVTSAEIQSRGLRDIASVLATVPGFYDLYDLVSHNPGVRGISGGPRAMGSIIKVMIDGQQISIRSNSGNLLGPELVPIQSVERVEIIRGPASALYGGNAFLGVVNIVTRDAPDNSSHFNPTLAVGSIAGNLAYSAGFVAMGGGESSRVMVACSQDWTDRSGLQIADSSPALARVGETLSGRGTTENDISTPGSILAKASFGDIETTGQLSIWSGFQSLNSVGEFLEYYPLSHQTVIALDNSTHRLTWDVAPESGASFRAWMGTFSSRPNEDEVISIGVPDQLLIRSMSDSGYEFGLESQFDLQNYEFLLGADLVTLEHTTQTFDTLLLEDVYDANGQKIRDAGTVIPSSYAPLNLDAIEVGLYGQVVTQFGESVSLTGGIRMDTQDHGGVRRYEYWSPRLAVVVSPPEAPWTTKLMYGSSYKPPSIEQLYTAPIQEFDIQGNEDLEGQSAETYEFALGYRVGDRTSLLLNAYLTKIDGLVRYIQEGLFSTAQNATNEIVAGGELDALVVVTDSLSLRLGAGYAYTLDSEVVDDVTIYSSLEGIDQPFPTFQLHLLPEFKLAGGELIVTPELSWISARPSSRSNAQVAGDQYMLPSYALSSLAIAAPSVSTFGDRGMGVHLRVSNIFDAEIATPGFGGIDYPDVGRTIWLTVQHDLL